MGRFYSKYFRFIAFSSRFINFIAILKSPCYNPYMNYFFDKDRILSAICDFYAGTGIAVALYDAAGNTVTGTPIYSSFCEFIRQNDDVKLACHLCDKQMIKKAQETKQPVTYTCHAGLVEVTTPILYEDMVIAYMQIGQFRDREGAYSNLNEVCRRMADYGFKEDELCPLYARVPAVGQAQLQGLLSIMNIIIRSFWVDGLIYSKKSLLSVKIEGYISERLGDNIYVENICRDFFLSKNSLYKLFREEFGVTVNEFILQKRLAKAKGLLEKNRDLTITEVAALCGFNDYNYFIRVFKKSVGTTPLKYKKAHCGNE